MSETFTDQVPRLEKFRAEHPDIEIRSPRETGTGFWRAYRNGALLGVQAHLVHILDLLEKMPLGTLDMDMDEVTE